MFRFMWKWHKNRKGTCEGSGKFRANHLSQSISFQSVKNLDEFVRQYGGRKSGSREAEFQERNRKEWACLQRGGKFVGFRFHCPSLLNGGRPDSENSKLVKAQTVPKMTSRNPGHAAGAHWHRYRVSMIHNYYRFQNIISIYDDMVFKL